LFASISGSLFVSVRLQSKFLFQSKANRFSSVLSRSFLKADPPRTCRPIRPSPISSHEYQIFKKAQDTTEIKAQEQQQIGRKPNSVAQQRKQHTSDTARQLNQWSASPCASRGQKSPNPPLPFPIHLGLGFASPHPIQAKAAEPWAETTKLGRIRSRAMAAAARRSGRRSTPTRRRGTSTP
jgi:hypothetical protein